jgi:hypothetical protein
MIRILCIEDLLLRRPGREHDTIKDIKKQNDM